ncbi:UBA/TS-N domain containing protein [Trichomonas vaginalis G3]|uniref:UBA/TS-N domain containing protein n=1 Tax=Trichomonas vaginalis (strain ATCC PRA-98 / G3) TaxID=412133 RepID=A2DUZ3_TRIV3|nr:UV excision repair protein RAD23 family [Trichomonas vaginalis G3]EAY15720.1 UBA/TS-N domain containing protein [Trichomonas vaginalis G3]KAI5486467.1 UV excision repair protein RAD23 family [Trichomonas vaginalis G3]|eukprot:XP_001327943.1 UBA/TS-N domain containing protein [Trichomonas vaginalis G3]
MGIIFKFINGGEIKLEPQTDVTVKEAKKVVGDTGNLDGEISLIYKGRILNDDEIVNNLEGVNENFIIVHNKHEKRRIDAFNFLYHPINPLAALAQLRLERRDETDPPNFEELITNLVELGFERSECERALRITSYDPNNAASLLLSGSLSGIPTLINAPNHLLQLNRSDDDSVDESSDEAINRINYSSGYERDQEEEEELYDNSMLFDDEEDNMSEDYSEGEEDGEQEIEGTITISAHDLGEIRELMRLANTDFHSAFNAYNDSDRNFDAALFILTH